MEEAHDKDTEQSQWAQEEEEEVDEDDGWGGGKGSEEVATASKQESNGKRNKTKWLIEKERHEQRWWDGWVSSARRWVALRESRENERKVRWTCSMLFVIGAAAAAAVGEYYNRV